MFLAHWYDTFADAGLLWSNRSAEEDMAHTIESISVYKSHNGSDLLFLQAELWDPSGKHSEMEVQPNARHIRPFPGNQYPGSYFLSLMAFPGFGSRSPCSGVRTPRFLLVQRAIGKAFPSSN